MLIRDYTVIPAYTTLLPHGFLVFSGIYTQHLYISVVFGLTSQEKVIVRIVEGTKSLDFKCFPKDSYVKGLIASVWY